MAWSAVWLGGGVLLWSIGDVVDPRWAAWIGLRLPSSKGCPPAPFSLLEDWGEASLPLVPDEQGPNRAATPPPAIWLSTNGPSLIDLPALSSPVVRHGILPVEDCRSLFRSIFSKAVVRTTGCQAAEFRLSGGVFDLREDRNGSIPGLHERQLTCSQDHTNCLPGSCPWRTTLNAAMLRLVALRC